MGEAEEARHGEGQAAGGRWQRRAARHEAERRRMPKHGKAYVTLAQQLIARRAIEAAAPRKARQRRGADAGNE